MISSLSSSSDAFLNAMDQVTQRMNNVQRQLSTGLRVSSVSDDPDSVSAILQTRSDLDTSQQIQANLANVKTETDTAEQAMQSAVSLMEKVRVLGAQGVTETATPQSRQALGDQVGAMLEEVVGLAGTKVQGRFIFSGDADGTAPYTVDLTSATPVSPYAGGPVTRQVQHPNGSRFTVARSAQEIFDSSVPGQNVLTSLTSLRTALQANDTQGISDALTNVASSLNYLNSQLAFYGTVQNKVADATNFGNKLQVQLKTQLSSLQDADITSAAVELAQATTQQTAALQAHAKIPRTTLFDFLG